jgi:two-component system NtrC family response regulator
LSCADLPDKVRGGAPPVPGALPHSGNVINLPDAGYSLEQLEREVVVEALERNLWNQTAAARFLRIPRHTLIYRIEKYGIVPSEK